ncbi:hypothetical protein BC835DRAFT_1038864 [Cytidiella melzeri]|nr:hypothetical protein BC835DRAFT_1038864 [Cytidiella melzeri]
MLPRKESCSLALVERTRWTHPALNRIPTRDLRHIISFRHRSTISGMCHAPSISTLIVPSSARVDSERLVLRGSVEWTLLPSSISPLGECPAGIPINSSSLSPVLLPRRYSPDLVSSNLSRRLSHPAAHASATSPLLPLHPASSTRAEGGKTRLDVHFLDESHTIEQDEPPLELKYATTLSNALIRTARSIFARYFCPSPGSFESEVLLDRVG